MLIGPRRAGVRLAEIYGPGVAGARESRVAGTARLGGAARSLACLYLEGPDAADLPEPGDPVVAERGDGAVIGRVTSAVRHWEEGPLALALMRQPAALGAVLVGEFRCGVEPISLPTHAPVAVTIRESGEKSVVGRD